jgi:glycosyltransferase involved in cell wall biosynthesis
MFDVIVPIYNVAEPLLTKCFDSIAAQTFQEYEVWVCDGKPSEETKRLVESYGFNYLEQDEERKRVGGARNQAISCGKAPFIAFLDGDDWWYDYHLEVMKRAILESKEEIAVWSAVCDTVYRIQSAKTGETYEMKRYYGWYEPIDFIISYPHLAYYWFFGHPPAPTVTAVRRDAFEEVGGFDERFSILEDTECWMRICGDPRKGGKLKGYAPVLQISGFHTIGENNTTNRGSQTPAFETDIESVFSENSDLFLSIHPLPLEQDKPTEVSVSEWKQLSETFGGVNRTQVFNL